ncbi:MAG TPA: glycoside hydrolase family 5 protein [Candidatus Xenobia bacterium]
MTARRRALALLILVALLAGPGLHGVVLGWHPLPRGVNDAGGEWMPAPDGGIRFSSPQTLDWLASLGVQVIRLPMRWESLQPFPDAPLNPAAVQSIRRYVDAAWAHHMQVVLDIHNFGAVRWGRPPQPFQIGQWPATIDRFAAFWRSMAEQFRDTPGIYGYDIMNEPDLLAPVWKAASQKTVEAIRQAGDRHVILVEGCNWASAYMWVACHGSRAWIDDPLDNTIYEAHLYFDAHSGGDYAMTFPQELAADPQLPGRVSRRLDVFINWCEENGVRGFLGEFGCPPDPGWLAELRECLATAQWGHLGWTWWAAGEAWPPSYDKSIQPQPGYPRPQVAILQANLPPGPWPVRTWQDFKWGYRLTRSRAHFKYKSLREQLHQWRQGTLGG